MSKASRRWASSPRASATEAPDRSSTWRSLPSWPSSAKAREKSRSPTASARSRPDWATTVGRPRRSGAASRTSSCTRVAMWTSSIAAAARTAGSPAPGPAQSSTSIGRRRLPPAARVAPASAARSSPCPSTRRRRRSSTASIRIGSQASAASSTIVTGGGTAVRFNSSLPCHPSLRSLPGGGVSGARGARVDSDDAAREHEVADSAEARRVHPLREPVRRREALHGFRQVAIRASVPGERPEHRDEAVEPEREEGRQRRPLRMGDLQDHEAPTRAQDAGELAEPTVEVLQVAGPKADRGGVERAVLVRKLERVRPLEAHVRGAALGRLARGRLEHALGEVAADDGPLRTDPMAQLERQVPGAAADIERRAARLELGELGGSLAPAMVRARGHRGVHQVVDARDAVEHRPHLAGELVGLAIGKWRGGGGHDRAGSALSAAAWLLQIGEEVGDLVELLLPQTLEGGHDARARHERAEDRRARDARPDMRQIGRQGAVAAVADLVARQAGRLRDHELARLVLGWDFQ